MRLLVQILILVNTATFVASICPPGCNCNKASNGESVICDGTYLGELPSLLNPRTKLLSLRNCGLTKLEPDILHLYPELEIVDVSNNSINHLDSGVFQNQLNLRVLILRKNRLRNIRNEAFHGLLNLQELDLSNNEIEQTEAQAFQDLSGLIKLKLEKNHLSALRPTLFEGTRQLQELWLSENRISYLDSEIFKYLPKLELLDLSSNKISEIDVKAFQQCLSLKHLNLGHNHISNLKEDLFVGLYWLEHLNLTENQLDEASFAAIRKVSSLLILDLSRNKFSEISTSAFDRLEMLHSLILSKESELRKIQLNAFSGLPRLHSLDLSLCHQLQEINENAFEYSDELRRLDLSHCNLRKLHPSLVQWTKLTTLKLDGNQFDCDCNLLAYLPRVVKRSNTKAICASPSRLAGQNIADLEAFCSEWQSESKLTLIVAIFLGISSAILVIICFRKRYKKEKPIRLPTCSRPFIVTPLSFDKNYEISKSDMNLLKRYDAMMPMLADEKDDDEDESYYSSLVLPGENGSKGRRVSASSPKPIPPPETTIPTEPPGILIPPLMNQSFRVISKYPVPITEL